MHDQTHTLKLFSIFSLLLFSNVAFSVSIQEVSTSSRAFGISGDGNKATGVHTTLNGLEAFLWTSSSTTNLGDLPGGNFGSSANALSFDGSTVVGFSNSGNGDEAFIWTSSGGMVGLGDLAGGGFSSTAEDISDDGTIVIGTGTTANGNEAFRWTSSGGMGGLGFLPGGSLFSFANGISSDGSVIVGSSHSSNGTEAFSWTSSGGMIALGDLPGGAFNSSAEAASSNGAVIVGLGTSANGPEAFRFSSGTMTGLGDLPGGPFISQANAVSGDGSVVVGLGTTGTITAPISEAFIWTTAANSMRNIKNVLLANGIDMAGWVLTEATGISNDGKKIVGYGKKNGTVTGWYVDINGADLSAGIPNDFNGDGKSDIFWRHAVSNNNKIQLMNSNLVSSETDFTFLNDPNWIIVGNSDFNKDVKRDLLWRNIATGANKITLMNGATVQSEIDFTIADVQTSNWQIAGVGDFDGDGNDDIFWHNDSTGENRIAFMNGTTAPTTTVYVNQIPDTQWKVAGIGDFNLDGKDDVLWRHALNKRVWLYQMDGVVISNGGGIGEHVVFTAANWNIEGVGDFNADGRSDILWRNSSNGRVWMYYMNGKNVINGDVSNGNNSPAPGEHVAFTALVWNIKAIGDYNGDGKQDIFWRNDVTGENYMYLMNGVTLDPPGGLSVTPINDLNWKVVSK